MKTKHVACNNRIYQLKGNNSNLMQEWIIFKLFLLKHATYLCQYATYLSWHATKLFQYMRDI